MNHIVDKSSPIPLYLQLANWIESMIKQDRFTVGAKLPSEGEIAKMFQLNRNTVRHAISLLIRKDLLVKQKGVGTFVKRKTALHPIHELGRMTSFIDDFSMDEIEIEDRVISKEKIAATPELADKLMVAPEDNVVRIERIRIAEKTPFVLEIQYYRYNDFKELLEMDIKGSMYQLLTEKFNADLDHSIQTLRAIKPTKEISQKLGIPTSTPCIFLESLAYTSTNICIEVLHSFYRGDRYIFKVETGKYMRGMDTNGSN